MKHNPMSALAQQQAQAIYLNGLQRQLVDLRAENDQLRDDNKRLALAKTEAMRIIKAMMDRFPVGLLIGRKLRGQAKGLS